jgi:hypothetical protein
VKKRRIASTVKSLRSLDPRMSASILVKIAPREREDHEPADRVSESQEGVCA